MALGVLTSLTQNSRSLQQGMDRSEPTLHEVTALNLLQDSCSCARWIARWGTFPHVQESLVTMNFSLACFQCCGTAIFLLYLKESPHPERNNVIDVGQVQRAFPNFPPGCSGLLLKFHCHVLVLKQRFQNMLGPFLLSLNSGAECFPSLPSSSETCSTVFWDKCPKAEQS